MRRQATHPTESGSRIIGRHTGSVTASSRTLGVRIGVPIFTRGGRKA